jgi:hypothetical protein
MDPITLILTSLVAGASALAKGSLSEAGKDLYKAIRARVQQKLQAHPQAQIILAEYQKDPETWEKPLKKVLKQTGVEQDQELLKLANQLLVQIHYQRGSQDVNIANSSIINSPIITGDFKVEQRGTHNVYIGKAGQVVIGSQNTPTQMREIKIDLRFNNGEYPKLFWIEEAEPRNLFADGSRKVTREWWDPANFNRDHLRQILLAEVNSLARTGWELVETNLDDLWQVEHSVQETFSSRLTNLVGMSVGHTWKNTITIFGARFHVRRAVN